MTDPGKVHTKGCVLVSDKDNEQGKNVQKSGVSPEKSKKAEKPEPRKKGFFARTAEGVARWSREMKSELKKVVWPTREQTVNNTVIALAVMLFVGAFIWAFDWIAGMGVQALLAAFS